MAVGELNECGSFKIEHILFAQCVAACGIATAEYARKLAADDDVMCLCDALVDEIL